MSLESAMQRVAELRTMLDPAVAGAATGATGSDPEAASRFAAQLAQARGQGQNGPPSSMASAYPLLHLQGAGGAGLLPLWGASPLPSGNLPGAAGPRIAQLAAGEL